MTKNPDNMSSKDKRHQPPYSGTKQIYGGLPAAIMQLDPENLKGFRRFLQDIENQVRREADYDHEEMRRADSVRMLVWMRVLTRLAVEDIGMTIMGGNGRTVNPTSKWVLKLFYDDNREEMKKLIKASTKDVDNADDISMMTQEHEGEINESMKELAKMEQEEPEGEENDGKS